MLLSAYNNATQRRNLFNQTDLTFIAFTGRIRHTILAGTEVRPAIHNQFSQHWLFQQQRYVSAGALYENPIPSAPVTYRQNATDANNDVPGKSRRELFTGSNRSSLSMFRSLLVCVLTISICGFITSAMVTS